MAQLLLSEEAQRVLRLLPEEARAIASQRLEYAREMPRMYALADDERFPGCRTFWVDPCYRVFYMVAAGGDDTYVLAITQEDVDAPEDGGETLRG